MIAKLHGKLDSISTDSVIVDVGGVGYLVFCSGMTLRALPAAGATVTLVIETHVREDHIHLYGFFHDTERRWFKALQDVQGVGAKVALSLLSAAAPNVLARAIVAQDDAPLRAAQGVGPKLAKRILIEMKDRAPTIALDATRPALVDAIAAAPAEAEDATMSDAVSALVNLGYGRGEAFAAVATAARAQNSKPSVAELIRGGLSELGRAELGR
jgi:Holliday junction DNA helicase RuvA